MKKKYSRVGEQVSDMSKKKKKKKMKATRQKNGTVVATLKHTRMENGRT